MKTYSNDPRGEDQSLIVCGICGNPRFTRRWDCGDFAFVRCHGCGVHYQNPQPVQNQILERYDDDYFAYEIQNEDSFLNLMLLGLGDVGFSLTPPGPRARFLDIGCATGLLLKEMRRQGWETVGVEVCEGSARYGRQVRGLDIRNSTLEDAQLEASSLDVIHFSHLIEHLNQPLNFLKEVHRILKPGGLILVTTPNTASVQARLFQKHWRSAIADHLYLFSQKNLALALTTAGFEVEKVKTWGGLAVGYGPKLVKKFLDKAVKKWGQGDVMLMSARKASLSADRC